MIISESAVSLQSSHKKITVEQEHESLRAWVGEQRTETMEENTENAAPRDRASFERIVDRVRLSAESLEMAHGQVNSQKLRNASMPDDAALMKRLKECAGGNCGVGKKGASAESEDDIISTDSKLSLMKQLVEVLSGKEVRVYSPKTGETPNEGEQSAGTRRANADDAPTNTGSDQGAASDREGWGVSYDYSKTTVESERTSFTAEGIVQTKDGRQIEFAAKLQMERERVEVSSFQLRAGDARLVDPLVLNFDGDAADLTEEKFNFDLNSDGIDESISFVADGSGFLVHDKNGDGIANNGGELFGPSTGSGFAELAAHDDDGNGWIDEADGVYKDLRIWQGGAQSGLIDLKSAGVGAIYLGSAVTPFENRGSDGSLLGQTASTGVYLSESGHVGTVQQVDLVS